MILEGLVTTHDSHGTLNVAPMGPIVDSAMSRLRLRPFQTSQTFRNLREQPYGVFHITDDVELIARAALDGLTTLPPVQPAVHIPGSVLQSACRWYEFQVVSLDDSRERAEIDVTVVYHGRLRDFCGFHRARHAVLEATILATRLHLIPEPDIRAELHRLQSPVEKTASPTEFAAWQFVTDYIEHWYARRT